MMLRHRGRCVDVVAYSKDEKHGTEHFRLRDNTSIIYTSVNIKKPYVESILAILRNACTSAPHRPIVFHLSISTSCSQTLRQYAELLHHDIIAFDMLASKHVPIYELVSPKEVETLERGGLHGTRDKWPLMRSDDPIALYMGLKDGDVVHIACRSTMRVVSTP